MDNVPLDMREIVKHLTARLAKLEQELATLRQSHSVGAMTQIEAVENSRPVDRRPSRRGLLRRVVSAAAATAGAGVLLEARAAPAQASGTEGPTIFLSTVAQRPAVQAIGTSGAQGLNASSDSGDAISASVNDGNTNQAALRATVGGGASAVVGSSDHGFGVYGTTTDSTGTFGGSTGTTGTGIGVVGFSQTGVGVVAQGGSWNTPILPSNTGVYGHGTSGHGVYAVSDTSDAIFATAATARGGVFSGQAAAVNLVPSTAGSHPASGETGDLFVDATGRLWYCNAGGSRATWVNLA